MGIIVGSARYDENGKTSGGAAGDQTGKEVSTQDFYTHSKGWYILRAKTVAHATALASAMQTACSNDNIGYDQSNRLGIITYGTSTKTKTECDCSSLVRQCVKEATGTDPGNFTTANEATKLVATGLFEDKVKFVSQEKTPVYNGDILVTCTKGHTVIVVSGNARSTSASSGTASASTTSKKATDAASSMQSSLSGSYKCNTNLNMRNGAGTSKTIMTTLPKGTVVKNYGYYSTVGKIKWLYVQVTLNGVQYTGFCSSAYLEKV